MLRFNCTKQLNGSIIAYFSFALFTRRMCTILVF